MKLPQNFGSVFLAICLLFLTSSLFGQKYLQLEKRNSPKTEKIPMGSMVSIKTKEFPKSWYSGRLDDVIPEEGIIVFDTKAVRVEDIIVLRKNDGSFVYKMAKWLSTALRALGINVAFWGTFDALISDREQLETSEDRKDLLVTYWAIGAGSYLSGLLLNNLFKLGSYKIGKKWQLRALDISIKNPLLHP